MRVHLGRILLLVLFAAIAAIAANATDLTVKSKLKEPSGRGIIQANRPMPSPLDEIYNSTDVPLEIPDGGFVESELIITDNYEIGEVNVFVNITHTYDRDIIIILESPSSTQDTLFNRRGGSGNDITNCTFDDEAELPIAAGQAPFEGSWRPEYPLSAFDGENIAGTWLLIVSDNEAADLGTLDSWGMEVSEMTGNVGHIYGIVTDINTGDEISGAHVELVEPDLIFCTDQLGEFLVENLPTGPLTINVSHELYQDWSEQIVLDSGELEIVEVELSLRDLTFLNVSSTAAPVPIFNMDSSFMSLSVTQNLTIYDVNCEINISHTYTDDLEIWLESPDNQRVQLVVNNGSTGDNFVDCIFDDESCQSIYEAAAPFTGTWRPLELLSLFDGTDSQGDWTLIVYDAADLDTGQINNWILHLSSDAGAFTDEPAPAIAESFTFYGAYPNPFNASTTFSFDLARAGSVSLILFDLLGRETVQIWNGSMAAGNHEISFNATDLTSGLYFAALSTGGATQTQKVVQLK